MKPKRRKAIVELLTKIKTGQPHTHSSRILAPLSQAALVTYEHREPSHLITNVRLTAWGESWLAVNAEPTVRTKS